jgi:phosphatidylserine decarboxylase
MSHNSPIAREGVPFIIPPAICTILAIIFGSAALAVLLGLITLFIVWFFRNPERNTPGSLKIVTSPADGRVIRIEEIPGHDHLAGPLKKISIFMNVFNVHVNRIPCDGTVDGIHYHEGRFLSANLDKASKENERNAIIIRLNDGRRVMAVQIAGLIARRIVCWIKEGMVVKKGERFGLIRFGSRLDVFLPPDTTILVSIGDKVKSGETPLGELT